jgi:hypothetical protein|tara:strand:- start:9694 stop:11208 length:1515 start_codon:yes stop_codon:yes gene_type:complete
MKTNHYSALTAFILFAGLTQAQITIDSSDMYVSPDTFNIVKTTNAGSLDIKTAGMQTWDFRSMKADSVQPVYLRNLSSTNPVDNKFKDAEMVLERPGEGNAYLILTKDSLTVDGFADFNFDANIKADVNLDPDLKLMEFPVNYQNTFNTKAVIDSTIDTTILVFGIPAFNKLRVVAELEQNTTCDAYGDLKTVQTTFNTIRLRTVEKQTVTAFGRQITTGTWTQVQQTITVTNRYTWLAKNRGYQVAEVTTDSTDQNILTAQFLLVDSLYGYINDEKNPNCFGESNGSASFKTIIGSKNYTYDWGASANNQQTSTATNLKAGTHILTVTDLRTTETFIDTLVLTNPDSLLASIVFDSSETSAGKDGKIEVVASGGTPPYTYSWDRSSSTGVLADDLEGGVHTITIKDVKGCAKVLTKEISTVVSVEAIELNNKLSLYPNPSNGLITVNGLLEVTKISIVDITGAEVLNADITPNEDLDISVLKPGIYFLRVNENIETSLKLLVQ